jgi:glycosyltransferase involved in cell wall biosynthesis
MAKVSVIIPHYEDLEGLRKCLAALDAQTYSRSGFEIVVGDNNSPCGPQAVEAVIAGRAKLVVVTERGAGPARNGAVTESSGEILAFTDSDCVPEPQWLSAGLAALADYDFVGGRVDVLVDDPEHPTPAEAFERVFAFNFEDYILKKGFTGSGNMFVARKIFDHVGGFRVGVSEDAEWSFRARAMGYRLGYAPDAAIGHPARRSWAELKAKTRRINSESYNLMLGQKNGRLRWLARSMAMPLSAVAHTPKVVKSPKLPSVSARIGALATLYRLRAWRFVDCNALLLGLRK